MEDKMILEIALTQIAEINKRYDEIAHITGENFNIFNILGLTSDETRHSKILAMLLNPKGPHNKGTAFLKYFLKYIPKDIRGLKDFPCEEVSVECEYFIPYNEKYRKAGRIDIVITDNTQKKQIFIENKIYAGDQDNQLSRYKEYNPKSELIYLTLDGKEASKESVNDLKKEQYHRMSYEYHILKWLKKCKRNSVDQPFLRETINQYILLIKQLTGQARSNQMNDEILNVVTKDANTVSAFFSVNMNDLIRHVIKTKFIPALEKVAKDNKLELSVDHDDYFADGWGFYLKGSEWKKIQLGFLFTYLKDPWYGILTVDKNGVRSQVSAESLLKQEMIEDIKNRGFKILNEPSWILRKEEFGNYKDWKNRDVIIKLCSPDNDVIKTINDKIHELLDMIKGNSDL
jgi:hypothetical protein